MNLDNIQKSVIRYLDREKKKKEKEMKDKAISYIRTYAPILAGALISWLATLGLVIDTELQSAIIIILTAILQGLYYALARFIGSRFPAVEKWLLGSSKTPQYK